MLCRSIVPLPAVGTLLEHDQTHQLDTSTLSAIKRGTLAVMAVPGAALIPTDLAELETARTETS